jgi:uncharacterized protein YbjT (DUF2867 family)
VRQPKGTRHDRRSAIGGGLGKTGRRVLDRLAARGIAARAASRSTNPRFDWTDRTGWEPALAGATAAYVTYQPDLAVPHAAGAIGAFADAAAAAGIRHVVLLTGLTDLTKVLLSFV